MAKYFKRRYYRKKKFSYRRKYKKAFKSRFRRKYKYRPRNEIKFRSVISEDYFYAASTVDGDRGFWRAINTPYLGVA